MLINNSEHLYATLELQTYELNFSVTRMHDSQMMVVYKKKHEFKKNILDEFGKVLDIKIISKILDGIITEYERSHNGYKIFKIASILPSTSVKIAEKYQELEIKPDSNGQYNITKTNIQDIISLVKRDSVNKYYSVIDAKTLSWTADDSATDLKLITRLKAKKIGVTSKTFEIPTDIFESHLKVIKSTGRNIMYYALNIDSIYRSIESNIHAPYPMLIANWKANQVEVGYYQNGALMNFKVINKGINNLIQSFSKAIKAKENIAKDYLFNLIDFSSANNAKSELYQKWDSDTKMLKKYTVDDISKLVQKLIANIYKEIKDVGHKKTPQLNLTTYNFGMLREIPGVESLLRNGVHMANDYVFNEFVLGVRNTTNFEATIGIIKTIEKRNGANTKQVITSTITINSKKKYNDLLEYNNVINPSSLQPSIAGLQPQYLLNEGILIDSKESNKL